MAGDLPPDLLARAERYGLTRGDRAGRSWRRGGQRALVWPELPESGWLAGFPTWLWAPEPWAIGSGGAGCFASEAEALAAACDWLDAGEPEVPRG